MPRIALGLEYDGSQFHGWQKQKDISSIQETLEKALSQVAGHSIQTICAGRTDAGVHATEQVVHFDTEADRSEHAWVFGANTALSHAIRVLWTHPVTDEFNARRSATSRRYRYVIYNHPVRPALLRNNVCWYYRKLDVRRMREAAQYWVGEHDFSSFRAATCQSRSPIRHVHSIDCIRMGDQVVIDITANAFLHHMVRNLSGVLIAIGAGKAEPEWAEQVLRARDRRSAGMTASPNGLYLVTVCYPSQFGLPKNEAGPWFLRSSTMHNPTDTKGF